MGAITTFLIAIINDTVPGSQNLGGSHGQSNAVRLTAGTVSSTTGVVALERVCTFGVVTLERSLSAGVVPLERDPARALGLPASCAS